jgi:hypothetical protein
MKSLYITGKRFSPKPSATNFSSAAWSCTKTMSASPRRAMSSAWPVPTATTRTSTFVASLISGSRCLKRPDCSVDVVEAMVMTSLRRRELHGGDAEGGDRDAADDPARQAGEGRCEIPFQGSSPLRK